MAKLTPRKEYRKDGSTNTKAYSVTLRKTGVEDICKMDENTDVDIIYSTNKIEIIKKSKKI